MPNDSLRLPGSGITIAADSWGDETAAPVLLLHGGGQTRHAWKGTGEALAAEGYRAISIDLRGHGDSGWADDGDYSQQAFVADLKEVVRHLEEPPALVGASLGGIVSLLALGEPGPPIGRALVLVDVVPRIDPAGAERIGAFMRARPEGFASLDEAAEAVAAYVPGRPRPPDPTGLRKSVTIIPMTSSITTGAGSLVPKCRSATLPLHEPIANRAAIAVACTAAEAGKTAHKSRPAAEPHVPGARGK